jgi:hypothetical protein
MQNRLSQTTITLGRDMQTARLYLTDDLDFQGSIDTFRKADDFIAALTMFQKMLRRVNLIQSFFYQRSTAPTHRTRVEQAGDGRA